MLGRSIGSPLLAMACRAPMRTSQVLSETAWTRAFVVCGSGSLARALAAAARTGETSSLVKALKAKSPTPPKGTKPTPSLARRDSSDFASPAPGRLPGPSPSLLPRQYRIEDLVGRCVILELHQ